MVDLKELLGNLATGEDKKYSSEDIKAVTDEYKALVESKGNVEELEKLKKELEESNNKNQELEKKHQELKDRMLDKIFNSDPNPKSNPDDKSKKPSDEELKFKDLVNPDYQD